MLCSNEGENQMSRKQPAPKRKAPSTSKYLDPFKVMATKRKCRDCGKITSDYRCTACQRKFKELHDVSPDALSEMD
jgi:hypothetical protein